MIRLAPDGISLGPFMTRLFIVRQKGAALSRLIHYLLLLDEYSDTGEWGNQVTHRSVVEGLSRSTRRNLEATSHSSASLTPTPVADYAPAAAAPQPRYLHTIPLITHA